MKLLTQLFKNRQEKNQINKMLAIAAHENILEPKEIDLLTKEIKFLSYKELAYKQHKIQNFKKNLPVSGKEKFKIAFLLLSSLMKNEALSKDNEEAMCSLIQVISVPKEKARELVSFLKSNIQNGLNLDDSYMRLGYLLDKPTHV